MDFDKILFTHWYIWSMMWHIIFPNFSTELWPLIDFRIMFMLNILWNNWWIWSNLVDTLIFFYAKTCTTTKISTVVGYHEVLATLLFYKTDPFKYNMINPNSLTEYAVSWCEPHTDKTCLCHMQSAKTQISLHIGAVWSASLLFEPHHEKTCFSHMHTTKVQISLHIRTVWSAPLLFPT